MHYRAGKLGLVDAYAPPTIKEIQPWAQKVAQQSKSQSVGVYARVLGIGCNSALAIQKKLGAPACWKDLAKPGYAGEVYFADPKTSGASYFAIAAMSQIFGEDQAFNYLDTMYKPPAPKKGLGGADASAVTPKGTTPPKGVPPTGVGKGTAGGVALGGSRTLGGGGSKGAASEASGRDAPVVGDAIAGIGFIGDVVAEAEGGAPVKAAAPCEGTMQEVGTLSIVKGARNLDNAKKFVDWALGAKAQGLIVKVSRAYPANSAVASAPLAPKWSEIKSTDYDAPKNEKTAARKRLTERWTGEIASSAQ